MQGCARTFTSSNNCTSSAILSLHIVAQCWYSKDTSAYFCALGNTTEVTVLFHITGMWALWLHVWSDFMCQTKFWGHYSTVCIIQWTSRTHGRSRPNVATIDPCLRNYQKEHERTKSTTSLRRYYVLQFHTSTSGWVWDIAHSLSMAKRLEYGVCVSMPVFSALSIKKSFWLPMLYCLYPSIGNYLLSGSWWHRSWYSQVTLFSIIDRAALIKIMAVTHFLQGNTAPPRNLSLPTGFRKTPSLANAQKLDMPVIRKHRPA